MVRKCTEQDRAALNEYLEREPVYNTFILADIADFGFASDFQTVYADMEGEACRGVYLRFYGNLIVYSRENRVNKSFLEELFKGFAPDVVMGKVENIRAVGALLPAYSIDEKTLYLLKDGGSLESCPEAVSKAGEEDVEDIYSFIQTIPEIRGLYTSKQMIADRIAGNAGIHYIIRKRGEVIAHANSTAECEATVMIGGVAVKAGERGAHLAGGIVSGLCREILKKGKKPCLFTNAEAGHNLYERLGFERAGGWAALTRRQSL